MIRTFKNWRVGNRYMRRYHPNARRQGHRTGVHAHVHRIDLGGGLTAFSATHTDGTITVVGLPPAPGAENNIK